MITDILTNFEKYIPLNKNFKIIFDFLKTHNLSEFEAGRHEIDGDKIFFNINEYETKPSQKLEAHKKYIDIQIVINGEEYMGYTNIGHTTIKEEYDENKDVMFLNGDVDKIKADKKNFLIFYPDDAHMPALCLNAPKYVKKVIFKIKID